jgi:nitroreductase
MSTLEAIAQRRSIRRFRPDPIPDDVLLRILTAGTQAPSGGNSQPWRFVVVQGEKRAEMVRILREAVARVKGEGGNAGSAPGTANCMEQAPVTVFVCSAAAQQGPTGGKKSSDWGDVQAIGAAIQNMLLAAEELGIGSLWICDVFYAYAQFCEWLGQPELIAAVSFGYSDEQPAARPRKPVSEVTTWL